MIIGLDISTSITGITFLSDEGDRIATRFVDTRKEDGFFRKAKKLKHEILQIIEFYRRDCLEPLQAIYIEQSLQAFRPGLSSAKTLLSLAGMNKLLSFALFEKFELEPEYIGATSARKLCGIKVPKGQKAKQVVIEFLLDNEPEFVVQRTKHGNPKAHYFDMADSIVIARAGYELWKQKENLKS